MKTKKTLRYFATVVMASLLLTSFIAKAQTHVYKEGTTSGMFIDGDGVEVANPVSDAVNASANCARSGTGGWKKIEYFPTFSPARGSKLYFSVYNPNNSGPGQVQFEYTTGGGWKWGGNVEYVSGSTTGWKEYSINLSSHVGNTINKIIVFASGGSTTATYVDNVYFGTASLQPEEAVVYNEAISSGVFFQGNGAQVANPVSTFVNSSANCAASGTTGSWQQIQYFPSYTPVSGNKLFFSIYNPNNAVEGQIQFEYTTTGGWQFGGNVTYVSGSNNGWQEYSIDISSHAGNTINKIIMMPAGGSSSAVYVDNIYFGSTSTLAQQTIVYNEAISSGMFIDGDGSQVANPVSDFVNSTANCAKSGTGGWKKIEYFPTFSPASGSKLYFSVYNPNNAGPGQVQFEYTTGGGWKWGGNVEYVSGSLTGWAEYSIDLSSHAGNTINKIILFASGGSSSAVYVDNVYFGTTSTLPQQPVVYNETISSGMFIDGDGSQVANPVSDFVNSTANCAKSGTGGWKKIEYFPTFSPANGSKLYFSVYNPNNAGPGQVQFEYTTGGGWQWGGNVTYVSGSLTGWAEYSIDLTSHVGNTINKIIIFASGGSSTATYLDNVYFGTTSILAVSQIPTSPLSFCKGATVALAVGTTSLKFYSAVSGGTALSSTTALTTRTLFATEMIGAVESTPRVAVSIIVNALPTEVIGAITSNTPGTSPGTFAAATLAVGTLVGTTTTVSYRVPAFEGANSYFWTVPVGVRIVGQAEGVRTVTQMGANANVLNVNYSGIAAGIGSVGAITVQAQNANGCNGTAKSVTIAKALPLAPTAIVMNDLSLPTPVSGIPTAVTSFAKYMGTNTVLRLTATPSATATSYQWELPAGVNQLSGGTTNVITVNFAGVTSANSFNFNTAAAVSTNVLRIGVKAVNGVGVSTTSNTALVNPTTTSTAKLLTLTAVAPAAPTLAMFDMAVSSTVAVTDISKYIGTSTPLTLKGTVTATTVASSFTWELPEGVNVVAGSVIRSNSIMVHFEDVQPGTASLYVGIKAVNGMGFSVKSNITALPSTASTATLLKLTAGLPSAAGAVTGSLAICSNKASSVTYTITAAALKTSLYVITAPVGTTIVGGSGNTIAINAVAGATFTVNYPNGFTSTTAAKKTISIQSVNGFGVSATNKVLALTSNACTAAVKIAKEPIATDFNVIAYPNPSSGVFNLAIESSNKAATTIQVYDMQGRMIENKQVNSNTVEIGANYTSGIYNVILENAGQAKTIRLIKK